MPKIKKLPSGSWHCQVYSHTERIWNPDKKAWDEHRVYESFTGYDKKAVQAQAALFAHEKNRMKRPDRIKVIEAVQKYIDSKDGVLSPATIRGYQSILRNYLDDISQIELRDLTSEDLQLWIQKLSVGRAPKTVRNIYGLISATLDMFMPGSHFSVSLPQNQQKKLYTPSDTDVKRLLLHVQGKELEIAILLAAFGPMRRGEICALTDQDIVGNTLYINKVYVLDNDNNWVLKQSPKNDSSNRIIVMPDFVIERISRIKGEIVKATPGQISSRFNRAIHFSGLPHFRFHDLRHYCASILHAMNIPDQYIMARGGWATDNVMKRVYFGEISDEAAKFNKQIMAHFSELQNDMQYEMQNGISQTH